MNELKCTKYCVMDKEYANLSQCHCPVCGGFIKWMFGKPNCNKCKTELIAIPERDEETGIELDWGKICPISKPKNRGH